MFTNEFVRSNFKIASRELLLFQFGMIYSQKLLDWRPLDFEGNSPLDLIALDSPKINIKRSK